ncbi:MAG: hypothetical protein AMJ45_04650 [Syntrophobacter sp. DG_60]|nr:MAG: hypothetical protein AMJ45_04650 [Syntrophobacter sp. DG_60]
MKNGLKNIYDFISDHLYFYRPDLEISGEKYNATLLFSLLTATLQGKQLIVGEPGLGKTTSGSSRADRGEDSRSPQSWPPE